jgi:LmbE family N-acetylglucosaminyl deacetylase
MKYLLYIALILTSPLFLFSQSKTDTIKVLVVIAHPDDESAMAATIYKITREQHGIVDILVITNGEGGYKYSTLAENIYGVKLTDEKIGRENLPRIRKQELMNAGKILGVRNYFFLDQKDAHYGTDEHEPLDTSWNIALIHQRIMDVLNADHYDFVFSPLPTDATHGGHKAAALMALRSVQALPAAKRPVILGVTASSKKDTVLRQFHQYASYEETQTKYDTASFRLDRNSSFGYNNKLNYQIIVNWEIAEHKSQGVMQLGMNTGDYENFWFYSMNPPEAFEKCSKLFELLKKNPYPSKEY